MIKVENPVILKKTFVIFFTVYYSLGILFLPMGNFSTLSDLPEMYNHCKANEDKDMTPLDFITDHLLNIDGLFDKHDNGDEQKPHSPIHIHHQAQIVAFQPFTSFEFENKNAHYSEPTLLSFQSDNLIKSDYISKVFRPPIVA